jgi:hypothetical protein
MTVIPNDEFIKYASSLNKAVAITKEGFIYSRPLTSTAISSKLRVPTKMSQTQAVISLHGFLDCFQDKDICIVCGIGGCFSLIWENTDPATAPKIDKQFFHKKFPYQNNFDYSFGVLTLFKTTYFLVLESISGLLSAGLMRYDYNSNNCYVQSSPKISASDGTPPIYHMTEFMFSRKIAFINEASRELYFYDYSNIGTPLLKTVVASTQPNGPLAADSSEPSKNHFVVCQKLNTHICSLFKMEATKITELKKYNQLKGVESTVPSSLSVSFFPGSQFFGVAFGKTFLIYKIETTALATPKNEDYYATLLNPILGIFDREASNNFVFFLKSKIYSTKIKKKLTPNTGYVCSAGCKQESSLLLTCKENLVRTQDCVACHANLESTSWTQGLKCREKAATAGALPAKLSDPSQATMVTTGLICTNQTYLAAPAGVTTNPNLVFLNVPKKVEKKGLSTLMLSLIIGGSVLGLGMIIFIALKLCGKKGSEAAQYPKGGQMGMNGMGGDMMGGMGNGGNMMEMGGMNMDMGMQGKDMNMGMQGMNGMNMDMGMQGKDMNMGMQGTNGMGMEDINVDDMNQFVFPDNYNFGDGVVEEQANATRGGEMVEGRVMDMGNVFGDGTTAPFGY